MYEDKLTDNSLKKISNLLFFSSIFIGIFFISFELDNDVWFLLNGGRYVLNQGIPYIEPFTIHADMNFVMQQWLTGVIFWIIYNHFGGGGLIILVCLIFIAIVFIINKICMLISNNNLQVSVFVTTVIGILISLFMRTRPQIISGLLLIIVLYFMELYVREKKAKYLLSLPVLSLLLVNFHASLWPMIFVLMIPYIIDSFRINFKGIQGEGYSRKPLFLCIIGIIVGGFCNPYGLDAMTYLFHSYGYEQIDNLVNEMRPLIVTNFFGKIAFGIIFFIIICYTKIKMKLRYILLTLGMAYMAMSSLRNLFLFWLCGLFPLAYAFRNYMPLKQKVIVQSYKTYRLRKILTLLLGTAIIVMVYQTNQKIIKNITEMPLIVIFLMATSCIVVPTIYSIKEWQRKKQTGISLKMHLLKNIIAIFLGTTVAIIVITNYMNCEEFQKEPLHKSAINYLLEKNQKEDIVLWTSYNNGAYCEFRGIACYLDARAEVFLQKNNGKKDILYEYIELEEGKLHYKDFISKYNFTHFLTTKIDILHTYLYVDSDYTLIYEDDDFCIFEKIK